MAAWVSPLGSLKFVDSSRTDWNDRQHFFAVAARAIRQIVVDHARREGAAKRGSGFRLTTLGDKAAPNEASAESVLAVHEALDALGAASRRLVQVVEACFFLGLTTDEAGEALGLSARTVKREWRRWLAQWPSCRRHASRPQSATERLQPRVPAAVNSFLVDELLTAPTPERAQGRALTVAEVLGNASRSVGYSLKDSPAVQAQVRETPARMLPGTRTVCWRPTSRTRRLRDAARARHLRARARCLE